MPEENLGNVGQQFIDALHKLEQGTEHDTDDIVELFDENAVLINSAIKLSDTGFSINVINFIL